MSLHPTPDSPEQDLDSPPTASSTIVSSPSLALHRHSKRVVILQDTDSDVQPEAGPAAQKRRKKRSKANLKRNKHRAEAHQYLKEHPEVLGELALAIKHRQASASNQEPIVGPSPPRGDVLQQVDPDENLAISNPVNHPGPAQPICLSTSANTDDAVSEPELQLHIESDLEY